MRSGLRSCACCSCTKHARRWPQHPCCCFTHTAVLQSPSEPAALHLPHEGLPSVDKFTPDLHACIVDIPTHMFTHTLQAGIKNVAVHNLSPGMVTTELLMAGADTNTSKFFINCLGE